MPSCSFTSEHDSTLLSSSLTCLGKVHLLSCVHSHCIVLALGVAWFTMVSYGEQTDIKYLSTVPASRKVLWRQGEGPEHGGELMGS